MWCCFEGRGGSLEEKYCFFYRSFSKAAALGSVTLDQVLVWISSIGQTTAAVELVVVTFARAADDDKTKNTP